MVDFQDTDVYDGFELLSPDAEWSAEGTLELNVVVEARINTSFSLHCPPTQTVGWLALVACRRYAERLPKGRRRAAELSHFGGHIQPHTVEHGVDGREVRQDMKLRDAFGGGDTVVVADVVIVGVAELLPDVVPVGDSVELAELVPV